LPARFLFAYPPFQQDRWSDKTVSERIHEAVIELFENLWRLQPEHDNNKQPQPKLVGLDGEAKKVFIDFYDECGAAAAEAGEREEAAWCKLTGYAARLALVGQLARDPQSQIVTGEIMQAACNLTRWFGNEAVRIYSGLAETREQTETRELCEFIQRRDGTVTVRDVITYYWPLKNQKGRAEENLNALEKAERGKWEPVPTTQKGGQPTRRFRLFHSSASAEPSPSRVRSGGSADAEGDSSQKITPAEPDDEAISDELDAMPAGIFEL
jgi:hypothetical protein